MEYIKKKTKKYYSEIFLVKCETNLSFFTQKLLESCSNKQFYQVLEIIEYSLKFNLSECNYILQIFHSIAISMQNNTNTSFFDIWIYDITLNKKTRFNKLNCHKIEENFLRIHCFCTIKPPKKKKEPHW